MTLNAGKIKNTGGNMFQEPLDPGAYPARLVQVIDLGLQPQEFKGETKPPKNEIMTTYELLDEFMKDKEGNELEDKPLWKSEVFALNSLDSDLAKSTKRYFALDSEGVHGGDWAELLGTPCMVNIVQRAKGDKVYENISDVSAMRPKEAKKAPDLTNEPKIFTLDDPDLEVFNSLPDWIKEKIKGGIDFETTALADMLEGGSTTQEEAEVEEEDDSAW